MKLLKNVMSIILIFLILEIVGMIFINNKTCAIWDDITESADQFHKLNGNTPAGMGNAQNTITDFWLDLYDIVRYILASILLAYFVARMIGLAMLKSSPAFIAENKVMISLLIVGILLFIFAGNIMDFIIKLFEDLEGLI